MIGKRDSPDNQLEKPNEINETQIAPASNHDQDAPALPDKKAIQENDSLPNLEEVAVMKKVKSETTNNEAQENSSHEEVHKSGESEPSDKENDVRESEEGSSFHGSADEDCDSGSQGDDYEIEEDEEVSSEHEDLNDLDIEAFKKFCKQNPLPPAKRP